MPLGQVIEFDEERGVGVVRAVSGDEHDFHCTAIADGTRTISVGTVVCFEVVPGRRGRWEAASIEPLPGGSAPSGPA